jgi:acyl-CoA synthetase (NDP forming)
MAVCGPNNTGYFNLLDRTYLCTQYAPPRPESGPVALITQSGSLAIILSQDDRRLGFGYLITTGNEAVCDMADYLNFVVEDDRIHVVTIFIEVIRRPEKFAEAAREAARRGKRIVVVKIGRTEQGKAAVAAHSGAVAGDDALYSAFFRYHGVVRVLELDEMIETAMLFRFNPQPPASPNIAFVTLSGGQVGLIADLAPPRGLCLKQFSRTTAERLQPLVSPHLVPRNPLDAMGIGWNRDRFSAILQTLLAEDSLDTIAFAMDASSSGLGDALLNREMAEICAKTPLPKGKHIVFFTNTAAGGPNEEIRAVLDRAGIPILCGLRPAIEALVHWTNYREPVKVERVSDKAALASRVAQIVAASECERFRLLSEAGVSMVACATVESADDATKAAEAFGYPVALKVTAPTLLHKADLDLVRLDLQAPNRLREAFNELSDLAKRLNLRSYSIVVQPMIVGGVELIIAVRNEQEYGTVVIAGLGGTLVELMRDVSVRIGPVSIEDAREMLNETRAAVLLRGVRGKGPYDLEAAAEAIAALSRFGSVGRDVVASIEVNPLIVRARGKGAFGVDILIEPNSNDRHQQKFGTREASSRSALGWRLK